MDPIEAFKRIEDGIKGPFHTDGWQWALGRVHMIARRAPAAGDPERIIARASALLGAELGPREYGVDLLHAFCAAHMPAAETCSACGGRGRVVRSCHDCDHTHDCQCDCDGGTRKLFGDGSVVGVGDVAMRAGSLLSIVRWFNAIGVPSVRLARVAGVTAAYDGPALVLGTDDYRAVVTSVTQEAVPVLVPRVEEHQP